MAHRLGDRHAIDRGAGVGDHPPEPRLGHEFDAVGFFLSGHPLDSYEKALGKLGVRRYDEFEAATDRGSSAGRAE